MSLLPYSSHTDSVHLPLPHQGYQGAILETRDGRQSCFNAQLQLAAALRTQVQGPQGTLYT